MITQWLLRRRRSFDYSLLLLNVYIVFLVTLVNTNHYNLNGCCYSVVLSFQFTEITTKLYPNHNNNQNNNNINIRYYNTHRHHPILLNNNHHHHSTKTTKDINTLSSSSSYSKASLLTTSSTRLHLSNNNNDNDKDIIGDDRLRCCIPYILPLLDGDLYGKYIYEHIYVPIGIIHYYILEPLVTIYNSIPYFNLLLFLILSLGVRLSDNMSYNVRYNTQVAICIDIAIIIPELIGSIFYDVPGIPQLLIEGSYNFVFYAYMSMILYSLYMNLIRQKLPNNIPYISQFAEILTGPF